MFGHSDHAWLWTLKRTELLLNYSYHLWSSQILYLHTPQDTINLSYKKFRIWKIYLMRVPYCKTLLLLSCKLLFTSIQSTTKYIVFFKMPSYDFSISSCSLNIFSQETEKKCMIFFKKKRHISRQFSPQHYFLCADKFLWTFHGIDFNSISALVLCTFWMHVNTFYWLLAVPGHWMIQTSSVRATTL